MDFVSIYCIYYKIKAQILFHIMYFNAEMRNPSFASVYKLYMMVMINYNYHFKDEMNEKNDPGLSPKRRSKQCIRD